MIDKKHKPTRDPDRLHVGAVMLLVAGMALGLWLIIDEFRLEYKDDNSERRQMAILLLLVFSLGGLSLIGPPLLLLTARRRPWGAGRFLWFAHGTAAWLLWPPVVYQRTRGVAGQNQSMSEACFFYGTPLMAVYVTLSLLAAGHFRRSRRRRIYRSWQEIFGLLLGMVWACTGLYLISMFYRSDLSRP